MEKLLAWALTTLVTAFVGSYLAGYLKRKGENLATHEDLDKLVEQMKATTEATKQIEARIDDQVWNKQRQWEMKRDILFDATKHLAVAHRSIALCFAIGELSKEYPNTDWKKDGLEAIIEWRKASDELSDSISLVAIGCEKNTIDAFSKIEQCLNGIHSKIAKKDTNVKDDFTRINELIALAREAVRRELQTSKPAYVSIQ